MANSFKPLSSVAVVLLGILSFGQPAAAIEPANSAGKSADNPPMLLVQAPATTASSPAATIKTNPPANPEQDTVIESGGVGVREFQGDDGGQVLRLLARQAKINLE